MAGFFGPGGLGGGGGGGSSLDPQLMDALLAQFPGLEGLRGQSQQQSAPNTLQSMGYGWAGPTLYSGQGQNSFTLSPFEGAGGSSPESITAGLASGTFGKSASQQNPFGGQALGQGQGSLLSLPSLQLPMAQVNASQGGISDGGMMGGGSGGGGETGEGGFSLSAGDVLGGAQQALDMFGGSQLGQQTPTPGVTEAMNAQRVNERTDYTNLTGSPGGIPQSVMNPAPLSSFLQPGFGTDTTFSMGYPENFGVMSPNAPPQTLTPGTTFEMPGGNALSPTMSAPGGSAQFALGGGMPGEFQSPTAAPGGPQGDLLGGGINTLQGLMSLYGGTQSGDIGQLLSGGAGTLGGLSQMAPETMAQLSQMLGLGNQGMDLIGSGLGGIAGGYGLYQGIEQGDPMQALMGAAGLYSGAVPIANSLGAALPTLSEATMSVINSVAPQVGQWLSSLGASTAAGAGAGAGATAGATAAGAASGAASALAGAPMAAMAIATSLYNMSEQKQQAYNLGERVQGLTSSIPGHVAAWQKAPQILQQIQATKDPQEAARLYGELDKIQKEFETSGMEDFLQHGETSVRGRGTSGGMGMEFPEGPEITKYLQPYGQALDYGRLLAQDTAARGGVNVPNALSGDSYAMSLLGPKFNEAFRPTALLGGGGAPGSGSLLDLLGLTHGKSTGDAIDPNAPADQSILNLLSRWAPGFAQPKAGQAAGPQTPVQQWQSTGEGGMWVDTGQMQPSTPATNQFTNQDITNFLGGTGGADIMNTLKNQFDVYGSAWSGGYGKSDANMRAQLQGFQPGGYEQGLRDFMAQGGYESDNPFFSGQFDQQLQARTAADPMLNQLNQYLQGMQGLNQQAPQLLGAAQTSLQGAPMPQGMGGAGAPTGGGGIDLEALLRQLGYLK